MKPPAATAQTLDAGKQRLRTWLKMLKATRLVEAHIREKLRSEFGSTLPRFDVMAALDRHADGLTMSALSAALRVSNGNVTGIVARLVNDGVALRVAVAGDKRATLVVLTKRGRLLFAQMAAAHQLWIDGLFEAVTPLANGQVQGAMDLVGAPRAREGRKT